jgi:hypothetical protein
MKTGDLEPPWRIAISDSDGQADLTGVVSWRLVVSLNNGDIAFTDNDPTVVVDPGSLFSASVTHTWVDGQTDAAGVLRAEVVATWPGDREQTFPSSGLATLRLETSLD